MRKYAKERLFYFTHHRVCRVKYIAHFILHHLAQQPTQAYGPGTLERLREAFAASGFNIRKLAVEVAVMA